MKLSRRFSSSLVSSRAVKIEKQMGLENAPMPQLDQQKCSALMCTYWLRWHRERMQSEHFSVTCDQYLIQHKETDNFQSNSHDLQCENNLKGRSKFRSPKTILPEFHSKTYHREIHSKQQGVSYQLLSVSV